MISQLIDIMEVGTTGVAAAIAASHLGVYRIDLLMAVYFVVALAGQMFLATLGRMSRVPRAAPLE
jgi:hypothetical protein